MAEKQDKAKGLSPFLVDIANPCSKKLLNISLALESSTYAAFHGLSQTNSIYVTSTQRKGSTPICPSSELEALNTQKALSVFSVKRPELWALALCSTQSILQWHFHKSPIMQDGY